MGQSQLLLIVLGVIVVGAAIIIGMNIFQANAIEANRNGVTSDLLHIATLSQTYYKKLPALGGGNQDFNGFEIPDQLKSNDNGTYSIVYLRSDQAVFQGVGVEPVDGRFGCSQAGQYVTHRIMVYPDSIQVQIVY